MKFEYIAIGSAALMAMVVTIVFIARYKKCNSNELLVIYGHLGGDNPNGGIKIINGGGAFVWPVVQDYAFLDLTPMELSFSKEVYEKNSIPLNMELFFAFGITTEPAYMNNAAERLLGQSHHQIQQVAKEIITGCISSVSLKTSLVEIIINKNAFVAQVGKEIQRDFDKIGLKLLTASLEKVSSLEDIVSNVNAKIDHLNNGTSLNPEVEKRLLEINQQLSQINQAKIKLLEEQTKLYHALNKTRN